MTARQAEATLAERIAGAGHDWLVPQWRLACGNAIGALATTRNGGVSAGPWASLNLGSAGEDLPAARVENLRRVAEFLPAPPVLLRQVHGREVVTLDGENAVLARATPPVADAAVTREPGIVCAVLTADCLPVLFADRDGRAVGVAHAGWRGLAAGVLEATIAALAALGTPAQRLAVWLGPAIGPAAFEVGTEVHSAFCAQDPAAATAFAARSSGKWHADLYALARLRLVAAGVGDTCGGAQCTFNESERFFSYRRDRETGRQGTFIWIDR